MSEFNEKLCEEKHKGVDERLDEHEEILKEHSREIIHLKEDSREFKTEIKNLCEKIDGLITTMKWFIGLMVGSFVAFFFYAVQHDIFK